MRILLLEDEEAIRGFVRINLKRNGMDVTEAEDGETALALAEKADPPFDVALLDVMLPTISGFEVCGKLRERFPRMGIIMLTAKSQEEDKIRGLELGADDYVQKPFSPGELIARMRSLHRRMMPGGLSWPEDQSNKVNASAGAALVHSPADHMQHAAPAEVKADTAICQDGELLEGPFRLSATERRLWKNQEEIILTPTEWTLVKLLIERAGEGLSRDDILDAVWGRHFIGDLKIVDVNIRRIRQKIEEQPSDPQFIETLWGFGYRWKRSERR